MARPGIGLPVLVRGEVLGFLEFFTTERAESGPCPVTALMGLAIYPGHGVSGETLLHAPTGRRVPPGRRFNF
jgi:hypothetical protein